jgi:hypothetical protein
MDAQTTVHKLTAVELPCTRMCCARRVKSLSIDIQGNCSSLKMQIKAFNKLKDASGYGKKITDFLCFVYTAYRQLFAL